ncbi:acetolactate synthase large subunit [Alkalihalobacillus sp. CinArs1]|uniref:acetolactate synthase large subunit n=1 Tax=Alkalihalobacillus sp. CinArs1 TaxID=2995314 RepID=UPI0022DD89D8|nr:acetolactate synthase large subunit [Alkalihalobacillus sp. CinArs1]
MRAKARNEAEAVTTEMTGADILIDSLKKENVEVLFGYPGGAVLSIYDALYRSPIKHILSKHEQGSIHAAEGYARVSGKPGVVIATSGPGATNLVTGITDAMMDSLPIVIFTGQVASNVIGTDAFQEADVMGITSPITKHNFQVRDVKDLPRIIKEAFHIASTGRPGPVLVDIPKDVSNMKMVPGDECKVNLPGYQPTFSPNVLQIKKLADAIGTAKKPVILAGAGVLHANAGKELRAFSERHEIPVVNTLLGLGSYPGKHPLFLGMGGMHGTYTANMALYECDLLISIGARFDDRLTGNLDHFARHATVAHIDVDPAEIGKNIPTQIPIVSDAREALISLLDTETRTPETEEWRKQLAQKNEDYPLWYKSNTEEFLPQRVIELVHKHTKGDAIITTDVGQHQMWAAQYYSFADPNKWVTSGGLGTMGFGFPAAIGAQLAFPDQTVVSITGDGGFQMTLQELSVLQELNLPVKIVIVNNQSLGMVRQWQAAFYEQRYSQSLIPVQPDFVKLGEAYGIKAYQVHTEEEAEAVFSEAFAHRDPVLIDCRVSGTENVYPMIAPGKGLHEMIGVKP